MSSLIAPQTPETNLKTNVRDFWNANACGKKFISKEFGSKEFFDELERHRYALEGHILDIIPFGEFKGKKVLEIGCGLGTDAIQFGRAGADYHAVDLTPTSIEMVRKRFSLEGLTGEINIGDAEALAYPDNYFDAVYSHGVIHHTPNIEKAVQEIHRVLKPGGKVMVMVYHENSLNYYLNILLLRRLGLLFFFVPGGVALTHLLTRESREMLEQHKSDFKRIGWRYLSSPTFLSRNTDGAGNPLSRVYSATGLKTLFSPFVRKKTMVRYLNTHRLPLLQKLLPRWVENKLAAMFGWHIYIFAEK